VVLGLALKSYQIVERSDAHAEVGVSRLDDLAKRVEGIRHKHPVSRRESCTSAQGRVTEVTDGHFQAVWQESDKVERHLVNIVHTVMGHEVNDDDPNKNEDAV